MCRTGLKKNSQKGFLNIVRNVIVRKGIQHLSDGYFGMSEDLKNHTIQGERAKEKKTRQSNIANFKDNWGRDRSRNRCCTRCRVPGCLGMRQPGPLQQPMNKGVLPGETFIETHM